MSTVLAIPAPEEVLAAKSWTDLGLPATPPVLKRLRRAFHPDLCRHPRATDAFIRVQELFDQPEFTSRLATGRRAGLGRIAWTPRPGFEDLASVAVSAHRDLARSKGARFFTALAPCVVDSPANPSASLLIQYAARAEDWWFASAFERLDGRTAVWVAKRFAAAIIEAAAMGWVHGDIHPGTVVICPAEHGLRLDGWWSAVRLGERLTVKPAAPTPPRWLGGAGASEQLSVAQAAAYLRTVTAPKRLIEVFDEHATNPGSAGQFFSDVREVAHRVYGKAVWHELAEPAETPI